METTANWDLIVEDLGPKLYRYFCGSFNEGLADDLTQDTLLRLVNKYQSGEFDDTKGSIIMYAFGIARFVRLEALKKNRESQAFEEEIERLPSPSDDFGDFEHHQEIQNLRRGIRQLPEPQQEIILLMIDKEFTLTKIAELLEMPLGTIKSHVHRAKKSLYTQLSETEGESYGR